MTLFFYKHLKKGKILAKIAFISVFATAVHLGVSDKVFADIPSSGGDTFSGNCVDSACDGGCASASSGSGDTGSGCDGGCASGW